MLDILPKAKAIYRECTSNEKYELTINAGQEWHNGHALMSLHHTGYAVDLRTVDLPGGGDGPIAKEIELRLIRELGSEYYVMRHRPPEAPHIHIQFQRGIRVSNPGEFPMRHNTVA
jgi:hypothetical protein